MLRLQAIILAGAKRFAGYGDAALACAVLTLLAIHSAASAVPLADTTAEEASLLPSDDPSLSQVEHVVVQMPEASVAPLLPTVSEADRSSPRLVPALKSLRFLTASPRGPPAFFYFL